MVVLTPIRSGGAGSGVGHGSVWPSIPSTISTMALPPYAPHRHGVGMRRGWCTDGWGWIHAMADEDPLVCITEMAGTR